MLDSAMEARNFSLRDLCCELLLECDGPEALRPIFEAMIPDLGDDQDTLAFLASETLSADPSAAKPVVLGYLLDPRPEARATTVWALGFIEDPETLPHLQASLTDPEPHVRAQAMGALGSFSENAEVRKWLLAGLSDPGAEVRMNAVSALGFTGDPEILAPLLSAMEDVDAGVRRQAAYALGQLGFYEAVGRLQQASTGDPDPHVQQEAATAVKRIQGVGRRSWGGSAR